MGKLMIPFKVEVDLNSTQLASFRSELRTDKGFLWKPGCRLRNGVLTIIQTLDQALLWSDSATSPIFGGDHSFQSWSTKAQVLNKLGRTEEADAVMKKALPYANIFELHQYGRQLLAQRRTKKRWKYSK